MADILIGDLTNGGIVQDAEGDYSWVGTGVFDKLMAAVNGNVKVEYDNGRITGPDYANVYLGSIQSAVAQSVQYVLQEKQIEAQIGLVTEQTETEAMQNKPGGLMEAQIDKMVADAAIAVEQLSIAKSQNALEKAKAAATIDKEYGFNYTLDGEGYILVGEDAGDGKMDAEVAKMQADADTAKLQADGAYAEMLASIRKEYGYTYTLDANDELDRSSLTPGTDGKIDYEKNLILEKIESEDMQNKVGGVLEAQIEKMTADVGIAEEQLGIVKDQSALERAKAFATIAKEYGFAVSLDANNRIVVGADQRNGKIDHEVDLIKEKVETEDMQNKTGGLIDSQITGIVKDNEVKTQQVLESTYKVANILPKELEEITAKVTLLGNDSSIKVAQKLSIDEEVELLKAKKAVEAEATVIAARIVAENKEADKKAAEVLDINASTAVKGSQKLDVDKSIAVKTAQIASMGVDDTVKAAQSTKDLAVKTAQISGMDKDIAVKTSKISVDTQQITSMASDSAVKVAQSAKDLLVKDAQVAKMAVEGEILDAKLLVEADAAVVAARVAAEGKVADKLTAEIADVEEATGIKAAQISKLGVEEDLLDKKLLVDGDAAVVSARVAAEGKAVDKLTAEISDISSSKLVKDAQKLDVEKSVAIKTAQITKMGIEEDLLGAKLLVESDATVVTARVAAESKIVDKLTAEISDISSSKLVKDAQKLDVDKSVDLKTSQIAKMSIEEDILDAKLLVESDAAVVSARVAAEGKVVDKLTAEISDIGASTAVKGAQKLDVEKSVDVKTAQITGMAKDIDVKTSAIAVDAQKVASMVADTAVAETQSTKDLLVKDGQILDMKVKDFVSLAQHEKDLEVKAGEILLTTAKTTSETDRLQSAAKDRDLKAAQKTLIDKQSITELQKAYLAARQESTYNDSLRVEQAKAYANVAGMYGAGGESIAAFETQFMDALGAVVPDTTTSTTLHTV